MENDIKAIEKNIEKYLVKEIELLNMINSVEMFANSTFNTIKTKKFYNFLIDSIGKIEMLYFMEGQEKPYHPKLIKSVKEFRKALLGYKDFFLHP